jgi:hypothetical protein
MGTDWQFGEKVNNSALLLNNGKSGHNELPEIQPVYNHDFGIVVRSNTDWKSVIVQSSLTRLD